MVTVPMQVGLKAWDPRLDLKLGTFLVIGVGGDDWRWTNGRNDVVTLFGNGRISQTTRRELDQMGARVT